MENQQGLPTIELKSEDEKVKLVYLGGDFIYLSDETNTIQIHLGNVEWAYLAMQNL